MSSPVGKFQSDFRGKNVARQGEGKSTSPQAFFQRANLGGQRQVSADLQAEVANGFPRTLKDSYNAILRAQRIFAQFPARVREAFSNDPMKFVQGVSDTSKLAPEIKQLLIDSNIIKAPKVVEPEKVIKVEVVSPPGTGTVKGETK